MTTPLLAQSSAPDLAHSLAALGGVMGVMVILALITFCVLMFLAPLGIWYRLVKIHHALRDEAARRAQVDETAAQLLRDILTEVHLIKAAPAAAPVDDSNISFSCPECGNEFEADQSAAGQDITCPSCHTPFHIH